MLIAIVCVTQLNAAELSSDMIKLIEKARSYGDFRFDLVDGHVYINATAYWDTRDAQQKERFYITLAKYMAHILKEPQDSIVIYDNQTGKKIGEWGADGLKVNWARICAGSVSINVGRRLIDV